MKVHVLAIACVTTLAVLTGSPAMASFHTQIGQPDLVPVPRVYVSKVPVLGTDIQCTYGILCQPVGTLKTKRVEMTSFCDLDSQGRLVIRVKNRGRFMASPTVTRVIAGATSADVATPALVPGETATLTTKIRASGGTGGWSFTITVDANNQIAESSEANNSVSDSCIT